MSWTPFIKVESRPITESQIKEMAKATGMPVEAFREKIAADRTSKELYQNNLYQVAVRELKEENQPTMVHLSIKRLDKAPAHDWRHFQRIKNELVGVECEGVELYPAESRLVDAANQYHLWVVKDPTFRMPLGFDERMVANESTSTTTQRVSEDES